MFHVLLLRDGPEWDPALALEEQSDWKAHAEFMNGLVGDGFIVLGGPLADERRVVHVVEAASEDEIRERLARDPWSRTHLVVGAIDPWTILLDGR
ncbi:MAG TPA: YciI family protein [Gaiellaceae bacterium]|nr:YciI family protein [Gaiellaceae bacterium]